MNENLCKSFSICRYVSCESLCVGLCMSVPAPTEDKLDLQELEIQTVVFTDSCISHPKWVLRIKPRSSTRATPSHGTISPALFFIQRRVYSCSYAEARKINLLHVFSGGIFKTLFILYTWAFRLHLRSWTTFMTAEAREGVNFSGPGVMGGCKLP